MLYAYRHFIYSNLLVKSYNLLKGDIKFITAGCSQNAAAFKSYALLFLYDLVAAGCSIWGLQPINFDGSPYIYIQPDFLISRLILVFFSFFLFSKYLYSKYEASVPYALVFRQVAVPLGTLHDTIFSRF